MAARINTRDVSWKEAAERKESVVRATLEMPNKTAGKMVGVEKNRFGGVGEYTLSN